MVIITDIDDDDVVDGRYDPQGFVPLETSSSLAELGLTVVPNAEEGSIANTRQPIANTRQPIATTGRRSWWPNMFNRGSQPGPYSEQTPASDTHHGSPDPNSSDSEPRERGRSRLGRAWSTCKLLLVGFSAARICGDAMLDSASKVSSAILNRFTRCATRVIDPEGSRDQMEKEESDYEKYRAFVSSNGRYGRTSSWEEPPSSGVGRVFSSFKPWKWTAGASTKPSAFQQVSSSSRSHSPLEVTKTISQGWNLGRWFSGSGCHHTRV